MTTQTATLTADDVIDANFARTTLEMAQVDDATVEMTIREYSPEGETKADHEKAVQLATAVFKRGEALLKEYRVVESERFPVGADQSGWHEKRFMELHKVASPVVEVFGGYVANNEQACYMALVRREDC